MDANRLSCWVVSQWEGHVGRATALTWLASWQDVLGDGDSVLGAAGPVHHAPPALHGEADVCVPHHRTLVDAQNCNIENSATEGTYICNIPPYPPSNSQGSVLPKAASCYHSWASGSSKDVRFSVGSKVAGRKHVNPSQLMDIWIVLATACHWFTQPHDGVFTPWKLQNAVGFLLSYFV